METRIYKGQEAERICQEIIDNYNWEAQKYYNHYGACGYFQDQETKHWVAFDNSTGDCWMEEFIGMSSAKRWISMN